MSEIGRPTVKDSPTFVGRSDSGSHKGKSFVSSSQSSSGSYAKFIEDEERLSQTPIPFGLNKWLYLAGGCVILFLFGPVIMNWGELSSLLIKEGAYLWECTETEPNRMINLETNTCKYQETIIGDIGILSQAFFFIGAFAGGCFMDQFGPKFVSILGSLGFSISFLLLGIGSHQVRTYYGFGIIQGFSVEFCFYSVCTIPNLFPQNRALILSFLGVARSLSMLLATLINNVRTDRYDANKIGFTFCAISLAFLLFGVFFTPHKPFKIVNSEGDVINPRQLSKRTDYILWGYTITEPYYIIWAICYALLFSRAQFHIVSIAEGLQNARVRHAFGYLAGFSFVFCPIIGALIDYFGAITIIFFLNLMGLASFICLLCDDSYVAQWFAVMFLTVILSFLGSQNYALAQERYIERLVGKLCGLVTCFGGLFSFSNISISHWAHLENKTKAADGVFIVYSIISGAFIILLWWNPPFLSVSPCFPDAPNATIAYQEMHRSDNQLVQQSDQDKQKVSSTDEEMEAQ